MASVLCRHEAVAILASVRASMDRYAIANVRWLAMVAHSTAICARAIPDLSNDPEYRLTRRQADQAHQGFSGHPRRIGFLKGLGRTCAARRRSDCSERLYPKAYRAFDVAQLQPGVRFLGHWLEYNEPAARDAEPKLRASSPHIWVARFPANPLLSREIEGLCQDDSDRANASHRRNQRHPHDMRSRAPGRAASAEKARLRETA
jgi:hypothetical protein